MGTPYFISALRNEADGGNFYRYFANAKDGEAATLSYSFLTSTPAGTPNYYGDPSASFSALTDGQKALVRQAFDKYEAVANVKFTQTDGTADIRFGTFDMNGNTAGYADYPQYVYSTGQLSHGSNFGEVWYDTASLTDNNIYLAMHEHPFDTSLNPQHPHKLPDAEDNSDYTVMSYTPGNNSPITELQIYDVIALQSIYGPARQRLSDDTYVFGKDKLIWDGGGNDTITASKAADDVAIDLNDGSWNYVGGKATLFSDDSNGMQVYLGNFTRIENLTGSGFDDKLTGNELANTIKAGRGDDQIAGGNGRDSMTGGGGADKLSGGKGADSFIFLSNGDSTVGAGSRDTIADFSHAQHDKLGLNAIDANGNTKVDNAFTFIGDDAFSKHAGELRFEASGANTLVSADTDGNGKADFAFLVTGDIHLVKRDLIL